MLKSKVCAIIGSRKTPMRYLQQIQDLSKGLTKLGYWIRTGGAIGADQAAMFGGGDKCLVYQPWKDYEVSVIAQFNNKIAMTEPTQDAIDLASDVHQNWSACSSGAKKLHGRNAHIILGKDLQSPVEFVICWSELEALDIDIYLEKGGTRVGCDIARRHEIPVYNLKLYSPEEILEFIK